MLALASCLLLAVSLAGAAPATSGTAGAPGAAPADGPPPARGIVTVDEVRPGQEVTAWTVFEGTRIEPFRGRVLGVARNYFGPARHIVLVDFHEERVRHTGIVHGMSGSPVYLGDRVLGAVALVLSPFPKDAVAGITPIEYMLADAGDPAPAPATAAAAAVDVEPKGAVPDGALLRPIATPLVFSGVRPEVFAHYRSRFAAAGLEPVLGAGGADPSSPLGADDLKPGAPVAAVLARGDLSLDASGTVTWRDGKRIYAFGHPFLLQGRVRFPMAPAEVVTTLADQTFSYKVTNSAAPAGTVVLDRLAAIVGEVGPPPEMFPLTVRLNRPGGDVVSYRYQVAPNRWLGPAVAEMLLANSLAMRWRYDEEATYRLRGTIALAGRPPLLLADTYAVAPDPRSSSPFQIAADLGYALAVLNLSNLGGVDVTGIDLVFDTEERGRIDRLEGVFIDPERVRAGDSARIRVAVRGLEGSRRLVPASVPIPAWAAGQRLGLRVTDSLVLRLEASQAGSPLDRAADLDQLIDILSDRPRSDRFHVQLLSFTPDAVLHHKRLPSLPASVAEVLAHGGGPFRRLPRAVLWEGTLPADGVAVGNQELLIEVRP
jgi:hypothetical protein